MKRTVCVVLMGIMSVMGAVQASDLSPALIEDEGVLRRRIETVREQSESPWIITPYKPNYVMPLTYNPDPARDAVDELDAANEGDQRTDVDEVELKFQFSFMLQLAEDALWGNGDIFVAYSQVSFWQAYNNEASEGFRDTNYEPEGFVFWDTDFGVLGMKNKAIRVGLVHQSNGRGSDILTRSWNRVYANFLLERGNFVLGIRPWVRIPEDETDDENPDIDTYMGYGEVRGIYRRGDQVFSAMLRNNLRESKNRGAVELAWSFPIPGRLKGYIQYFNGYGESLLDYNTHNQRIGVGLMLSDWL